MKGINFKDYDKSKMHPVDLALFESIEMRNEVNNMFITFIRNSLILTTLIIGLLIVVLMVG